MHLRSQDPTTNTSDGTEREALIGKTQDAKVKLEEQEVAFVTNCFKH